MCVITNYICDDHASIQLLTKDFHLDLLQLLLITYMYVVVFIIPASMLHLSLVYIYHDDYYYH